MENGVLAADYMLYVNPFANHMDDVGGGNGFSGEFWGKWFTYIDYILLDEVSMDTDDEYINVTPSDCTDGAIYITLDVKTRVRPTHFTGHAVKTLTMCDYASAGNKYDKENLFRVWLPQPLSMNCPFIK